MRVGMISTYPSIECGVATYTKYLVDKLRFLGNEVYVVSQFGADGEGVYPVFNAEDPDLTDNIFSIMTKFTPDVVHIQHEYGLFGNQRGVSIIPLVYKFKLVKIPVVVTLHTVYEEFPYEERLILEALLRTADAIIVHEEYQKGAILEKIGVFENISVIPHGARQIEVVSNAKKKIGLNERNKVILLCGYFRPTKRFDRIIKIFPQIASRLKDAILVVAGKVRLLEHREYRDEIFRLIDESPAVDRIVMLRGQFPQETFDTIISAADVVLLPYLINSQSGIMAHCLAFGRPVVVSSEVKSLKDLVVRARCGFVAKDDQEFVELVVRILGDDQLRYKLSSNARVYVKKHISWEIVAGETAEVYHKVIHIPYGRSRYIQL